MAKGTGVYNFDVQAKWLDNYEREQLQVFSKIHPNMTEVEREAYLIGIRSGWNKCRSILVFQNIIRTDSR